MGDSREQRVHKQSLRCALAGRIVPMTSSNSKSTRRWFQFSVRSLLIVLTICAASLGWYLHRWREQQNEQRKASAAVRALGGSAQSSFSSSSPVSMILERHNAENGFTLNEKQVSDDDLRIFESARLTRSLYLFKNKITDRGLAHLKNLPYLQVLDLRRNEITDDGLVHLENLQALEELYLINTKVTPAGIARLQQKLPNCKIAY